MTTSLAFCANTGVSLIYLPRTEPNDDPQASLLAAVQWHFGLNEPTVSYATRRLSTHLPTGAPDPDDGCLADFLVRNNGFIRPEGRTLDSSISVKDMP
jgi:hypothetical protein